MYRFIASSISGKSGSTSGMPVFIWTMEIVFLTQSISENFNSQASVFLSPSLAQISNTAYVRLPLA